MATPLTPSALKAVYVAEGIVVREYPNWRDRCRCHTGSHEKGIGWAGRAWGTLNGQVNHITAGDLGGRTVEQYIAAAILGDPNIPCKVQSVIAPNGDLWLVSAGRSNHAGLVGSNVQAHLVAADFSTSDDYDDRFRGGSADGNAFTIGYEVITSKTMTAAARATLVKANAAVARKLGWTGQESVGHGEISSARYFVDPGLNMGQFRRDVMARVKAGPSVVQDSAPVVQDPVPTPTPTVKVISASQNFAGNNARGIATASTRIPRYVAARKASPVNVINAQECTVASTVRSRLDSGLGALGYKRNDGGKGRYTYTRGVKVIAHGLITTPSSTWYQSDDKQAAWVIYELDGAIGMDVSGHLESDSGATADAKRVAQATYIAAKALSIANAHGCPQKNVMIAWDTNSESMVVDALVKAGWRNCASGTPFVNAYTFMGWDGLSRKRFDYALVRADAGPAEVVAVTRDTRIADHAGLRVVRELTK